MGTRTYTCLVEDDNGMVISEAWCRAYDVSTPSDPVLVETQYTDGDGKAYFTELPDDANVDIVAVWGKNVVRYSNVLSSDGDSIDEAVSNSHVQNTDDYAKGVRTGESFPADPADGELFYRTDIEKLYKYEA